MNRLICNSKSLVKSNTRLSAIAYIILSVTMIANFFVTPFSTGAAAYPDQFTDQRAAASQTQIQADCRNSIEWYLNQFKKYGFSNSQFMSLGDPHLLYKYWPTPNGQDQKYEIFLYDEKVNYDMVQQAGVRTKQYPPSHDSRFCDGRWDITSKKHGNITLNNDIMIGMDQIEPPDKSNACWHEANHAAIFRGGGAQIEPDPNDPQQDEDHIYIEKYAEYMVKNVMPRLINFETTLESTWDLKKNNKPADELHSAWVAANTKWNEIVDLMDNMWSLTDANRARYRLLTGVYFFTADELREFYASGSFKSINPPLWIFTKAKDTIEMKTYIEYSGPTTDDQVNFKIDFWIRSMEITGVKGKRPSRGTVRVQIMEDDPRARFEILSPDLSGKQKTLVENTHSFSIDLSKLTAEEKKSRFPFPLSLQVWDEVQHDTALHLKISYMDDPSVQLSVNNQKYDYTEKTIEVPIKAYKVTIKGDNDGIVGNQIPLIAEVKPDNPTKKSLEFEWSIEGQSGTLCNKKDTCIFIPKEAKQYNIKAEAYSMLDGKRIRFAAGNHFITVTKPDENINVKQTPGEQPPTDSSAVTEKVSFAGTAPDVWEGGNYDNGYRGGFNLDRKKAVLKGTGECSGGALVWSKVWGRINPDFAPSSEKEILSKLNQLAENAKNNGQTAEIRPITIGDFKGYFLDTSLKFKNGYWSDSGYYDSRIGAGGHGYLVKGDQTVEIGYDVGGTGCWNNSDRAFPESQAQAAQGEARGIIAGLQLVVSGSIKKTPYKGPKLDGSDMPKVALSPPALEKLKIGDVVNVSAMVENAKPEDSPFSYNWGGTFDGKPEDMKKNASVTIKPTKSGKYNLSVSVDGARFNLGSASLSYEVADYKVKLVRIPADNKPVPVGGKVKLKAVLTVDGKDTIGNSIFRWQPNTEVTFSNNEVTPDPKSPRNETVATFTKTGRTKVWVEVLEPGGQTSSTVATSDQIEIDVVEPKLKLTYEPKEPRAGQEVKVTVQEEPKMNDKVISFWWEYTGNAINPGPTQNERIYTYKAKDTKPVTVTVHAKAKDGGAELGSEKVTVTAKPYTVTISEPKPSGQTVQIFKCNTELGGAASCGFVDVKGQLSVFTDITMSADVTPKPEGQTLRYKWSVDPDGVCGKPRDSEKTRINCSDSGTYTVKVEVSNADGAILGEASQSVTISISQKDIDNSKKAKEAYDKLQKAKELVTQGKLDEGIQMAEEASKLDPKNTEATTLASKWKSEKQTVMKHVETTKQLIAGNKLAEAEKELAEATRLHPKYSPVAEAGNLLKTAQDKERQAQQLIKEAYELEKKGDLEGAIRKYQEAVKIVPDKKVSEHIAELQKKLIEAETLKKQVQKLVNEGDALEKQGKLSEAIGKYEQAQKIKPDSAIAQRIARLQEILRKSQNLINEGYALEQKGDFSGAVSKYQEAMKIAPDKAVYEHIAELQKQIKEEEQKKATAKKLVNEGLALEKQGKPAEAIGKFEQAQQIKPDNDIAQRIARTKETVIKQSQKLINEGYALEQKGDLSKAVSKYQEAMKIAPDKAISEHIAELQKKITGDEERKRQAQKLLNEGDALEKKGKLAEAIGKFEQAQQIMYSDAIAQRIAKLQNKLEQERKKATAKNLKNEGDALQKQNRIKDAISKYRESLTYWPDAELEKQIARLEKTLSKPPITEPQSITGKSCANPVLLFDNWNPEVCGATKIARGRLTSSAFVTKIAFHSDTNKSKGRLKGTLQGPGINRQVTTECVKTFHQWCEEIIPINEVLSAGKYTFKANIDSICQNSGSKGDGFMRIEGCVQGQSSAKPAAIAKSSEPEVKDGYIGCFKEHEFDRKDWVSGRDLSAFYLQDYSMTTEKCISLCREKGYAYAATQYGSQCFCDNSYGKSGKATNCNMPCGGNPKEMCGGSWANSVYRITK